jgi:hypothetical protein
MPKMIQYLARSPGFRFCLWQKQSLASRVFDSKKQSFTKGKSLIPRSKALPLANQRFLEAKLCLWQIKDSWKQCFAFGKSKILGNKVLPLANQRFLEAKFCLWQIKDCWKQSFAFGKSKPG